MAVSARLSEYKVIIRSFIIWIHLNTSETSKRWWIKVGTMWEPGFCQKPKPPLNRDGQDGTPPPHFAHHFFAARIAEQVPVPATLDKCDRRIRHDSLERAVMSCRAVHFWLNVSPQRERLSAKLISCVQYNLVASNRTVGFSHFEAAKEHILETTVIIEILCWPTF